MITKKNAETFLRASKKFSQISILYQHVVESFNDNFTAKLHEFNHNDVRAVKESLKKLNHSRKLLNAAKARSEKKKGEAALIEALDAAQNSWDE